MIRIVGDDLDHVHQVTCKNCAKLLEYTREDVKMTIRRDLGGGPDSYEYIVCPNCLERVVVRIL